MENEKTILNGVLSRILVRDWQSGYTAFIVQLPDGQVACNGILLNPREGSRIRVTGEWKTTKYGLQLSNCTCEEILDDPASVLELLKAIPGIGDATAQLLADRFGKDLGEVALRSDGVARLASVPGVSSKRAEAIVEWLRENEELRKLFEYLTKFDVNYNEASKIFREYGVYSLAKVQTDPYSVGKEVGMSFKTCDQIAQDCGIKIYDERRVVGALRQVLTKEANAGNCYLPYSETMTQTKKLLGVTAYTETIAAACIGAVLRNGNKGFVLENDKVYLDYIHRQERRTAFAIKRLLRSARKTVFDVKAMVEEVEREFGVSYDEKQREAFELIAKGGVGIVTGGPGTGKTTVIRGLLTAYKKLHPDDKIRLCAPTGRAAQRMNESTGCEASTIHRLLEYKPFGDTITCKNEMDPIDADLLLVDECSMISIDIAEMLFSAIKNGTMVILTGDIEQLPAVGAGNVLSDLLSCGVINVVALTKTFRQANGSPIVDNAKRIRDGITKLKTAPDFEVIETVDEEISAFVEEKFLRYHNPTDVFKCQILTPARRKYSTAANAINQRCQALLPPLSKESVKFGGVTFRVGDKVMFTRNNYEVGYMNGDVGLVHSIEGNSITVTLGKEPVTESVTISRNDLEDLDLAYATTVHKSQGSEYETVIVVLPSEPKGMLQRNLLYTAITRAKKRVIIVTSQDCISKSIYNKNCAGRKSGLMERLTEK